MANSCGIIGSTCNSASHRATSHQPVNYHFPVTACVCCVPYPFERNLTQSMKKGQTATQVLYLGVQLQNLSVQDEQRTEYIHKKEFLWLPNRDQWAHTAWTAPVATLLVTVLIANVGEALPEMMQSIPRESDSRLQGVEAYRENKSCL